MQVFRVPKVQKILQELFYNGRKIITFAFKTDAKITGFYYLTALVSALVPLASGIVVKVLVDQLGLAQNNQFGVSLILIVVLASRYLVSLAESVIYWGIGTTYLDYLLRYKLQNALTLSFHYKITQLDIPHFEDSKVQDLITKVSDTLKWRVPEFLRVFSYFFGDIVSYTAAFTVVAGFKWWLPFAITVFTLPRLYLRAKYGAVQWSIWGSGAPQVRKFWYFDWMLREKTSVKEMRIAQSSKALLKRFKEIQDYLYQLNKAPLDKYLKILTIPPIIETVLIIAIATAFLPNVVSGAITIGSFTLLVNMLEQLSTCAANASAHFGELYENNLYVGQYFSLLSLPKLIKEPVKPHVFTKIVPPKIEFKNVSFKYPESGNWALKNVSFVIDPSQSVAFVGHNGAGKSTIIKLICRFYDVNEGEILINGINIKKLKLANWYKFIGTLFQEFVQYHFSVAENITMGSPNKKSHAAMIEAAKKAGAHEFISKLPNKYEQILGKEFEDGTELSGGQWQKLAIARAFYEQPPILILDEPTSAIDAEAEYEIFNNLEKQYKNKSLILVSHRFSTVRNAQKIFVIENGEITEQGSHKELMAKKGQYAKLFNIQARGYK